jgi:cytoskeletal protein RodZ
MGVENRAMTGRAPGTGRGLSLLRNVAFWLFALTGCFLVGVFIISPLLNAGGQSGGEPPATPPAAASVPSARSPASSSDERTASKQPEDERSERSDGSSAPLIEVGPEEAQDPFTQPPTAEPEPALEEEQAAPEVRPYGEDTPVRSEPPEPAPRSRRDRLQSSAPDLAVPPVERPSPRTRPRRPAPRSETGSSPIQRGESLD